MPRKKQPSGLEDLLGLSTIIPWYISLILAAISFGLLHWYAGTTVAPPAVLHNPAFGITYLLDTVKHGAASLLQYLVPAFFAVLAVGSMLGRHAAAQLHDKVAADPAPNAFERVTWREFEQLVAETFRRQGYEVRLRGGDGPDGGVDVELHMGKDRYLVQCKQWKTRQVGVAVVRELYGVMAAEGAVGGFVVASGTFTPDAAAFAKGSSIELVDARSLRRLMGGHTATKHVRAAAVPAAATPAVAHTLAPILHAATAPATTAVAPDITQAPGCPVCGSTMVSRTYRKGPMAGTPFWGCLGYPKCRGIRSRP